MSIKAARRVMSRLESFPAVAIYNNFSRNRNRTGWNTRLTQLPSSTTTSQKHPEQPRIAFKDLFEEIFEYFKNKSKRLISIDRKKLQNFLTTIELKEDKILLVLLTKLGLYRARGQEGELQNLTLIAKRVTEQGIETWLTKELRKGLSKIASFDRLEKDQISEEDDAEFDRIFPCRETSKYEHQFVEAILQTSFGISFEKYKLAKPLYDICLEISDPESNRKLSKELIDRVCNNLTPDEISVFRKTFSIFFPDFKQLFGIKT